MPGVMPGVSDMTRGSCLTADTDLPLKRNYSIELPSSRFYDYRIGETLLVLFFMLLGFALSRHQHKQFIPTHDAMLDYPIRIDGLNGIHQWVNAPQIRAACTVGSIDETLVAIREELCKDNITCAALCEQIKGGGHGETVTAPVLILCSLGLPILLFTLHHLYVRNLARKVKSPIVGLFLSFAFAYCVTAWLKSSIGRPRPNFYALRQQALLKSSSDGSDMEYEDAYRSFPSGHASISMACFLYTSFWLLSVLTEDLINNVTLSIAPLPTCCSPSKLAAADGRRNELMYTVLTYVSLAPTILALWIASTRVTGYWHNYSDIIFGIAIGAAAAVVSFRTTYQCSIPDVMLAAVPGVDKWKGEQEGSLGSPCAGSGLLQKTEGEQEAAIRPRPSPAVNFGGPVDV
jgi:membrane-associated phospholipid phosphatase